MSRFPQLTEPQRNPLLKLVKYQQEQGRDVVFLYHVERRIAVWDVKGDGAIVYMPYELITLWQERQYISVNSPALGYGARHDTFLLCQEALDYERRMSKPRLVRGILGMFDLWSTDLRVQVLTVVGTLIAALIAALILNELGLLR